MKEGNQKPKIEKEQVLKQKKAQQDHFKKILKLNLNLEHSKLHFINTENPKLNFCIVFKRSELSELPDKKKVFIQENFNKWLARTYPANILDDNLLFIQNKFNIALKEEKDKLTQIDLSELPKTNNYALKNRIYIGANPFEPKLQMYYGGVELKKIKILGKEEEIVIPYIINQDYEILQKQDLEKLGLDLTECIKVRLETEDNNFFSDCAKGIKPETNTQTLEKIFKQIKTELNQKIDFSLEQETTENILSLWAISTYGYPLFEHAPRVLLRGNAETGKSQLVDFLASICSNAFSSRGVTASALRRASKLGLSILVDNADNNSDDLNRDLANVEQIGFDKSSKHVLAEKDSLNKINSSTMFCPLLMSAINGRGAVTKSRSFDFQMHHSTDEKITQQEKEPIDCIKQRHNKTRENLRHYHLQNYAQIIETKNQVIQDLEGKKINSRIKDVSLPILTYAKLISNKLYEQVLFDCQEKLTLQKQRDTDHELHAQIIELAEEKFIKKLEKNNLTLNYYKNIELLTPEQKQVIVEPLEISIQELCDYIAPELTEEQTRTQYTTRQLKDLKKKIGIAINSNYHSIATRRKRLKQDYKLTTTSYLFNRYVLLETAIDRNIGENRGKLKEEKKAIKPFFIELQKTERQKKQEGGEE